MVPENEPLDTELQYQLDVGSSLSGPRGISGLLIVMTTLVVWGIIGVNYN